jgi:hypothetical protein
MMAANHGFFFFFFPRGILTKRKKKGKKKTIKAILATCHQHALPWKRNSVVTILVLFKDMFWIVVVIVVQSAFHLEIHQNDIFYFFKNCF